MPEDRLDVRKLKKIQQEQIDLEQAVLDKKEIEEIESMLPF